MKRFAIQTARAIRPYGEAPVPPPENDKETKTSFTAEESERILKGYVSTTLFDNGLYCRADDRAEPVVQLSPPLICDQSHFDEMEQIIRHALEGAWKLI